jgi:hypothetical protein
MRVQTALWAGCGRFELNLPLDLPLHNKLSPKILNRIGLRDYDKRNTSKVHLHAHYKASGDSSF